MAFGTDYTPVGPMPTDIVLGDVDATSMRLARDIRDKGHGIDTRETMARMILKSSTMHNHLIKVNNALKVQYDEYYRQFNDVMKELGEDKDYYSLPEIAGARAGFNTLGERLNDTTAQLAQTTHTSDDNKIKVDQVSSIINTIQTDNADGLKDNELLAVRADRKGNVYATATERINKTEELISGTSKIFENLYDKNSAIIGEYGKECIMSTTGNTTYTFNHNYGNGSPGVVPFDFYDKDMIFISRLHYGNPEEKIPNSIKTPPNCAYTQMNLYSDFGGTDDSNLMFVEGEELPNIYIGFGKPVITLTSSLVEGSFEHNKEIRKLLDFTNKLQENVKIFENLYDKNSAIVGEYSKEYVMSTRENTTYTFNHDYGYGLTGMIPFKFYDKDMILISQLHYNNPEEKVPNSIKTPLRCAYTQMNLFTYFGGTDDSNLMFVEGEELPPVYIGFGKPVILSDSHSLGTGGSKELSILANTPTVQANIQDSRLENYDFFKYPLLPAWGHEYMQSWYKKIYNASESVTINLDGDSVTQTGARNTIIEKIMRIGGFPSEQLTTNNNGHGNRSTQEYVGTGLYYPRDSEPDEFPWESDIERFPNGILDDSMSQNPDLLIFGFGINDATRGRNGEHGVVTNLEQRLQMFEDNLDEFLKRVRGSEPINGRPAYNRSAENLSIILTVPTVPHQPQIARDRENWNQYLRPIIQKKCREYHCAFADFTMRHYDHAFSPNWANNGDMLHPTLETTADYMSVLQDLVYPIGMWNI